MGLSGQQRKKLQSALIDAFPTTGDLERMLAFELEKNLREIAGEGSLQEIVFNLIKTAEAQGWVKDLVSAASQSNPGNSLLEAIAHKLLNSKIPVVPTKILHPLNTQPVSAQMSSTLIENPVNGDKESEVDADYTALKEFIQQKKFKEADFETTRIILWIAHRLREQILTGEHFQDFPLLDLNTIDKLWLTGSNNKFGFSIQKQIWIDKDGNPRKYNYRNFSSFVEELKWEKDDIPCDLRAKKGYLPKGIYYVTREETGMETREKYLREYNEFIFKLLDEERNQRRMLERKNKVLADRVDLYNSKEIIVYNVYKSSLYTTFVYKHFHCIALACGNAKSERSSADARRLVTASLTLSPSTPMSYFKKC